MVGGTYWIKQIGHLRLFASIVEGGTMASIGEWDPSAFLGVRHSACQPIIRIVKGQPPISFSHTPIEIFGLGFWPEMLHVVMGTIVGGISEPAFPARESEE